MADSPDRFPDRDVWWLALALAAVIVGLLILALFSTGSGGSGLD